MAILPYQRPAVVLEMPATLESSPGGDLTAGGTGWMAEAFEAPGLPVRERGRRAAEALHVLLAPWAQERPRFAGRPSRFADGVLRLRPVQKSRSAIRVGATARAPGFGGRPASLARAGRGAGPGRRGGAAGWCGGRPAGGPMVERVGGLDEIRVRSHDSRALGATAVMADTS